MNPREILSEETCNVLEEMGISLTCEAVGATCRAELFYKPLSKERSDFVYFCNDDEFKTAIKSFAQSFELKSSAEILMDIDFKEDRELKNVDLYIEEARRSKEIFESLAEKLNENFKPLSLGEEITNCLEKNGIYVDYVYDNPFGQRSVNLFYASETVDNLLLSNWLVCEKDFATTLNNFAKSFDADLHCRNLIKEVGLDNDLYPIAELVKESEKLKTAFEKSAKEISEKSIKRESIERN